MDQRIIDSVNKYLDEACKEPMSKLKACETDLNFIKAPSQLVDYPRYLRALEGVRESVLKVNIQLDTGVPQERLRSSIEDKIVAHGDKEIKINDKFEKIIEDTENKLLMDAKKHNKKLRDQLDSDNQIYVDLDKKRQQLETYSDEIMEICSKYGVTTSDITISNASFTVAELGEIYDSYIKYMSKVGDKRNYVAKFRDIVKDNPYVEGVTLVLLLILAFTPVLDILSILFFGLILLMQFKAKDKMKSYSILLGLIYNIQPLQMGFKSEVDDALLVEEVIDEDNNPELDKIADAWEAELSALDMEDPLAEGEALLIEYTDSMDEIKGIYRKREDEFNDKKNELIKIIHDAITKGKADFEEAKKNMVKLGDAISSNAVFNTKFRLGIEEGVLEKEVDIGLQNIIIYPSTSTEFKVFLNVLFANAVCNIKAGHLTVTIYDPNNFGQDLVGFYNANLEQNILFRNENLDDTIKSLKTYAEGNMKTMGGLSINEYNAEAVAVGKTPKDYKLLIVLSQPKTIEENEALKSFMSYSAKLGVIVWAVMKTSLPDTKVFKVPFEGIKCPYMVDLKTFPKHVGQVLAQAINDSKVDGLNWLDYKEVANKDEDIWKGCTDKYVDIDPGFWEGDPTQFQGYTVGHDGDVHGIIVGGTGAGKSVLMNCLIINMARKYSPRELELWLADYKGSEFQAYLSTPQHPKALPHIKACLCTSDGEYAGSLYGALRAEAERRYQHLKDAGCKDMKEYNSFVRAGELYWYMDENGEKVYKRSVNPLREEEGYHQLGIDDLFSRIVFINDEFQVIFEKAEAKTVEQINKDITYISKVARACGVHLIFGSQSMNGTMKKDTLDQFQLRIALRCAEEVSKDILGTTFASDIKQRFGLLYVRSGQDKSKEAQKRFKTPYFACQDDFRAQIDMLADRAVAENMPKKDVIEYNELTKHYLNEVDTDYEDAKKQFESMGKELPKGVILLGRRMTYSNNKMPENIILGAENNSHVMSVFSDNEDLVNFYRTIRRNIAHDPEAKVFVNAQSEDLHYLCEIDKEFTGEEAMITTPKVPIASLIDMFDVTYELRKESGTKDIAQYYILIGWDKGPGFIIDKDYKAMEKMSSMLQLCGEYNMHFIFILSNSKGIDTKTLAACAYKICGKVPEENSYDILNSRIAAKAEENLKRGYMFLSRQGNVTKCKIYQSKLEREVKAKELVL